MTVEQRIANQVAGDAMRRCPDRSVIAWMQDSVAVVRTAAARGRQRRKQNHSRDLPSGGHRYVSFGLALFCLDALRVNYVERRDLLGREIPSLARYQLGWCRTIRVPKTIRVAAVHLVGPSRHVVISVEYDFVRSRRSFRRC
jgi:hypothetical protein